MGSLRTFHLAFVLIVFVVADLFGAWAVHEFSTTGHQMTLVLGVLSFLLGFAMIGYLIWLLRKLEAARIE